MKGVVIAALTIFACLQTISCQDESPVNMLNRLPVGSVIKQLPTEIINALAKQPQADGALSRNIPNYFHVRFQLDISFNTVYAIYHEDETALNSVANSIQYSFNRQTTSGDFDFVLPANLQHLGTPTSADLASGVAFFGSSLGFALTILEQSTWYKNLAATQSGKLIIENLKPKFQLQLNWLKQQAEVLEQADLNAVNRLLSNARCFLGLGIYLNDRAAIDIGYNFLNLALNNQNTAGYFRELNGFDSSYNGVSLFIALNLFTMPLNSAVHEKLSKAILHCADWQVSRILPSGEITTEGNTRVYAGGESFLGEEKQMAWIDTVLACHWLQVLNPKGNYIAKANLVKSFYE